MTEIGYLEQASKDEAAEVRLPGSGSKPSIGRVVIDDNSKKNNGYVEILSSDFDDESVKPQYRRVGYIGGDEAFVDEMGIIFKQGKKGKKEQIGYTACPSAPNTATMIGERSWKSLWLVSRLNVYLGKPNPDFDTKEQEAKMAEKSKKKDDKRKDEKEKDNQQVKPKENTPDTTQNTDTTVQPEEQSAEQPKIEHMLVLGSDAGETDAPIVGETSLEDSPIKETLPLAENTTIPIEEAPIKDSTVEDASVEGSTAPVEETPVEESPVEDTSGEEAPVEETTSHVEEAPVEEAPKDPFASLSDEEKTRLDNVKKNFPGLLSNMVKNMVKVQGGTFSMGDDPKDDTTVGEDGKARGKVECNESPKHKVTLDTYYIGKFPVTQAEWKAIMGNNPSECQDNLKYPVAPVNWNMAQQFVIRLSYLTGTIFTLPTEAQWEYAARGGQKSNGYTFSGSNTFQEVGHTDYKHAVGTKKPNELGIYDMSGLVREWCIDIWGHYPDADQTNPCALDEKSDLVIFEKDSDELYRVVRSPYGNETVTNRKGEHPELGKEFKSYGIRIACSKLPEVPEDKDNQTPPSPVPVAPTITDGGEKKPIAELRMYGFHNSKHDALSVEGRAGAYALLAMKYRQRKYTEYYKGHPYGWKDTAMLTSLVFTVMFLLLYVVNTGILHKPLLGNDLKAVFILIGYYFMLWSIVRSIKIDCVENSNSFQPKLDLFNKNLGLKYTNWSIIICGLIAIYFTFEYYDYGFIPLIVAIIIGVTVNMTLSGANSRWRISTSYREDDYEDEDEEETEVKNPDGDIAKTYDWDLDSRNCAHKVHGNLTLYFYANDVKDMRQCNPFYSQRSDKEDKQYIIQMFNFLKEHKSFLQRCRYIVDRIYKISDKNSLSPLDRIQFTLDFIQEPNIAFCENKDCAVINSYENYIRYPDETLYDKQGDANSKSLLGAILFHLMGYNVLYMASRKNQHSAIGVELPKSEMENGWYGGNLEDMMVEENGHKYLFCETTGDKFSLGAHIKGMSLDEFEERIVLPVHDEDEEEEDDNQENGNSITRVYQWTLDSWMGNKLDGQIALDFTEDEIYALRQKNPFLTYGQDQNTYEMNITSMFKYIFEEESRHQRVKAVADYIRQEITSKGYPTLDLVQFALDFAQKPNIEYCIDENSKGISYAKEYMRFPDEVMFDKEGDCDCKSSLTAALFHCLGYNVIFMLSKKLGHAAIGIEVQEEWLTQIPNLDVERVVREYNGRNYIYCETTSDGFKVGKLNDNEAINDFEKIVEIPV